MCKLGTKKHHDSILPRLDTLDLTGSFSMTEVCAGITSHHIDDSRSHGTLLVLV